jgi:hypothetical protein
MKISTWLISEAAYNWSRVLLNLAITAFLLRVTIPVDKVKVVCWLASRRWGAAVLYARGLVFSNHRKWCWQQLKRHFSKNYNTL